jgi:hypothetical protein
MEEKIEEKQLYSKAKPVLYFFFFFNHCDPKLSNWKKLANPKERLEKARI